MVVRGVVLLELTLVDLAEENDAGELATSRISSCPPWVWKADLRVGVLRDGGGEDEDPYEVSRSWRGERGCGALMGLSLPSTTVGMSTWDSTMSMVGYGLAMATGGRSSDAVGEAYQALVTAGRRGSSPMRELQKRDYISALLRSSLQRSGCSLASAPCSTSSGVW